MASRSNRKVFRGLWEAAWRHRRRTLLALFLLLLAKVAAVVVPLVLKAIVDRFSQPASLAEEAAPGALPGTSTVLVVPVFLLLGYAAIRFCSTLFTELRDLVFRRVTQRTVIDFAEKTFAHLLSLNPRFHVQRNTGSLIRDVERGTAGVGFLLGAGLFTLVPTLVELGFVLTVMALGYSLWFTLIILLTFFVYAGYTTAMTQKRSLHQRRVNDMDSRANGRLVDSLLNYETVKTHAREGYERERYAEICDQWIESAVDNQKALSRLHIGQGAIIACGVAAVMVLAGEQTVRGLMTVGDLVLVNSYVIQICLPLNALGFVFREARDALVNTEKLFGLLDQKPEIVDRPGAQPLAVSEGRVAFEHVDFAYEPGRQILQDVSFTVDGGATVAVVGGSGSGKSTLARLLLRLYDVPAGSIAIDGQDVRMVTMASLREAIGVVPQDTVLFNDTIAYNIAYGRAGTGMAEVIEAAKAAQVHEFIMSLPDGYDTRVGERGLKLSGGEKQRIAIARAFLKNPPILILDEATSALDTRAERAIQGELDRIAQGRTALVIAHRLSTIVGADLILVMDKGRIVERGRHEELLERDGLYAQLWNLQRQQQQVERLQRQMARQPLNLAVLAAAAIDGLRGAIHARGVRLYSEIEPEVESSLVSGDPGTLAQVLRELALAALQATPVNGRIELKLQRREGHARLSITDGRHAVRGASRQAQPPIVPGGVADAPTPLGADVPPDPLQLRSTIERQGGAFSVEPPSSVHGMRYLVELPLLPAEVPAAVPLAMPPGPAPLQDLRVMNIDGSTAARESLQAQLEAEGALVLSFASGREALDWLEREQTPAWPQVLVCDTALGDEDGYQFIRRVRQAEALRGVPLEQRVPAVALSQPGPSSDRLRSLMAGFQLHLDKPVTREQIVPALYALAGRDGRAPSAAAPIAPSGQAAPGAPASPFHQESTP